MTNEEKVKELANYHAGETDYAESAAYSAAMEMAEWKDKQFAVEKAELIDKACKWLKKELNKIAMPNILPDNFLDIKFKYIEKSQVSWWVEHLRKAMEYKVKHNRVNHESK